MSARPAPQAADDLPLPPAELIVADAEQLKALGDPLRLRLIEAMERRPRHGWTVKELAAALRVGQTRLYHHVNLLVERGLVRVAGTRLVSGIVERHYQPAARAFRLERSIARQTDGAAAIGQVLDVAMATARQEVLEGLAEGAIDPTTHDPDRRLVLIQNLVRLRPGRVAAFTAALQELIDAEDAGDESRASDHRLLLAVYPLADPEREPGTEPGTEAPA